MTIQARDSFTDGHRRRVTILGYALARELRLPEDRTELLRQAGLFHDIGGVAIPNHILFKPTPLNLQEFNLVKDHCQIGYDILNAVESPRLVADIVRQHHERMDGSGYPSGLSGGMTLWEARILAVADVVEAIISPLPHLPMQGLAAAMEEIVVNSGILYDPTVVESCWKLFTERSFKFASQFSVSERVCACE